MLWIWGGGVLCQKEKCKKVEFCILKKNARGIVLPFIRKCTVNSYFALELECTALQGTFLEVGMSEEFYGVINDDDDDDYYNLFIYFF